MKKTCGTILFLLVLCVAFLSAPFRLGVSAADNRVTEEEVMSVARGIISWKKRDVGATENGFLINDALLSSAGSTAGDWYPIALSRLGVADNQSGYLAVINDNVQKRYDKNPTEKLDRYKSTEWHRISLAVLACGGNPRKAGENGTVDLIADGVYDRVDENGNGILGRQGINGFIWGLIALDSGGYEVPADAYYSRESIITAILELQLADGGWALSGDNSDPDITAMAVQAFAPYYNDAAEYEYVNRKTSVPEKKTVRAAADEALGFLSAAQTADGDYLSWGMQNCESTAQVTVALCSLGIDPFADDRFIKIGADGKQKTLWDGLIKYRTESGGFAHSFVNDADNPTAVAGKPNSMASEQTLYTLAAIVRFMRGENNLYDMRDAVLQASGEFTDEDIAAALAIPENPTSAYRAVVLRLLEKLNGSANDFGNRGVIAEKLESAKRAIDAILTEAESIKAEIKQKLYPFDKVSLSDRKTVYGLYSRYSALSDYDKTLLDPSDAEGLLGCKTRVDNALTAVIVSACVAAAAVGVSVATVIGIKRRRRQKRGRFMTESDE